MEKWKHDFSSILTEPNLPQFDEGHLHMVEERLKQIDELHTTLPPSDDVPDCDSLNTPLAYGEVEKAVYGLKNNKAVGMDGIPAECLKNKPVIDILFRIFSYCFDNGVVPDGWLKGIINPIFKQDNIYSPLNYRGITIINVICKCYSSIINKRLNVVRK